LELSAGVVSQLSGDLEGSRRRAQRKRLREVDVLGSSLEGNRLGQWLVSREDLDATDDDDQIDGGNGEDLLDISGGSDGDVLANVPGRLDVDGVDNDVRGSGAITVSPLEVGKALAQTSQVHLLELRIRHVLWIQIQSIGASDQQKQQDSLHFDYIFPLFSRIY